MQIVSSCGTSSRGVLNANEEFASTYESSASEEEEEDFETEKRPLKKQRTAMTMPTTIRKSVRAASRANSKIATTTAPLNPLMKTYVCRRFYNRENEEFTVSRYVKDVVGSDATMTNHPRIRGAAALAPEEDEESPSPPPSSNRFEFARNALQLSSIPKLMPCRETEREAILQFLETGINHGGSTQALYVSGMPGTGKTATVHEAIRTLKEKKQKGKLSRNFYFVELNGMKIPNQNDAYSFLANKILGVESNLTPSRACQMLENHFSAKSKNKNKRDVCVLLLDELDHLVAKKQALLYNLFDWPQRPNAGLVVIAIANTLDLPERLLLPRIQSRLGEGRVMFPSYTHEQIQQIVQARLVGIENVFNPDAVEMCARKVSSASGDVRRALQLCRRASEICEQDETSELVNIKHINAAVREIDQKLHVRALATTSIVERLFLISAQRHMQVMGVEEVCFQDAYHRFSSLSKTVTGVNHLLLYRDAMTRRLLLNLCSDKLQPMGLVEFVGSYDCDTPEGPTLQFNFDYEDLKSVVLQQRNDASVNGLVDVV